MSKNPLIGKRFRSVIADCSCLFEVKATQGRGAFRCVVVNEPIEIGGRKYDGEFAGETRIFTKNQVEGALRMEELFAQQAAETDAFWSARVDGEILHYHNCGKAYVRCVVVTLTEDVSIGHSTFRKGEKALKSVALVGEWMNFDLRPGSYHVEGVRQSRLFRSHITTIFENPNYRRQSDFDPRTAEPVELPPMQQEMFG